MRFVGSMQFIAATLNPEFKAPVGAAITEAGKNGAAPVGQASLKLHKESYWCRPWSMAR